MARTNNSIDKPLDKATTVKEALKELESLVTPDTTTLSATVRL